MKDDDQVASLKRGLDVLAALCAGGPTDVLALSGRVKLNRTTVYRLVETLVAEGYAERSGGIYRATDQTRCLSEGYVDADWIEQVAAPLIADLGREILWPLALSTYQGSSMVNRYSTDDDSPYLFRKIAVGTQMSLVGTAAGRVFLAFSDDRLRDQALALLDLSSADVLGDFPFHGGQFRTELESIRRDGYCAFFRPDRRFYFLGVPVMHDGDVLASLTARVIGSSMKLDEARTRFIPRLIDTADAIARGYVEFNAAARASGADSAS